MRMLKNTLNLLLLSFIFSSSVYAQEYFNCSAKTGCKILVRPGMGWHVKLVDIDKGFKYICHIDGIAYLLNLNQTEAHTIGIDDARFSRVDGTKMNLSFSTMNLNVPSGYLYFDAENSSDIPMTENVVCEVTN